MIAAVPPGDGPGDLPAPSDEARAHSERLMSLLREEMVRNGGSIPFSRYMELALYAPGLGYYSGGSRKFGSAGDFVTAPELSSLFSRCLARQCAQVLEAVGEGEVLEFGAGSGTMAADILMELERLGRLPERYFILEVSGELKARQAETLGQRAPHLAERVVWLEGWPGPGFNGVVLANELLDAMPVHLFEVAEPTVAELQVTLDGDGTLQWRTALPQTAALAARLERLRQQYALATGYRSEFNLAAEQWVASLGEVLGRGVALLIDYGFPGREYYHPQRDAGTLMCHYRHRAHGDPLLLPGLQDITAHVDFTAVAEAALDAGLQVRGFTSQGNFLLATGITDLLDAIDEQRAHLEASAQVKRLTMPGEMGELFKVMALGRGVELPLMGFALRDERFRL